MVVVFLIAIISTVGLLKLGSGQNVAMEAEARQFVDKLNLLMDESIITGHSHRVVFERIKDKNSYYFQQWQSAELETGKWQSLEVQPYLKHDIDPSLALFFTSLGQNGNSNLVNADQEGDSIEISSDGSFNFFELSVGEKNSRSNSLLDDKPYWLVSGSEQLSVELVSSN